MVKVFVDTNVLLHGKNIKIIVFDAVKSVIERSFELMLHPMVQLELIEAASSELKLGKEAKLALQLTSELVMYEDESEYDGTDIAILRSAQRENGIVFTFDKNLRERCIKQYIPVISNYKKGRVQLFGYVD